MAASTTKIPPEQKALEKSLKNLTDVINRAKPAKCQYRGHQLLILTARTDSIVISIEDVLWKAFVNTGFEMSELDPKSLSFDEDSMILNCAEEIYSDEWTPLSSDELFSGKRIEIQVNEVDYSIILNKSMIGINLKKSEFSNVSYRIKRIGSKQVLSIKKDFEPITYGPKKEILVGSGFALVRSFYIA